MSLWGTWRVDDVTPEEAFRHRQVCNVDPLINQRWRVDHHCILGCPCRASPTQQVHSVHTQKGSQGPHLQYRPFIDSKGPASC